MMDISDVNKVANRKRINVGAENLREKVSRESAKIIKLKGQGGASATPCPTVATPMDTAYWDLKEKLQQLEGNHERLQQNMLDVQMQHETLSGKYQEELRLRPETLNKLNSTREICDVLEKYTERLKETVSRCKQDQATLCEAYQKSGLLVKDIKVKQAQANERNRLMVQELQDKLKLTSDHQQQLVQFFTSTKQQCDEEIKELKSKLTTAQGQKEELLKIANDMARDMDARKYDLDAREKTIASLQSDMKRLMQEYNNQCNEMKAAIDKQQQELKEASQTNDSLKKALVNQDEFSKSLCEQNNVLLDKVSALEDEGARLKVEVKEWQEKTQELTKICESLTNEVTALEKSKQVLVDELSAKIQLIEITSTETKTLKEDKEALEIEKAAVLEDLNKVVEESAAKNVVIEGLETSVKECEDRIAELEANLKECRITNEEKIKELSTAIEVKQSESLSKGETISTLMNDIKMCIEVRNRLEMSLERTKKEMEAEKEAASEKEKKMARQVELLKEDVQDKEQKLTKQINIIMESRAEKEKLRAEITTMQNKIDNIQKELTGRPKERVTCEPPELDDNSALLSPPSHKRKQPLPPPSVPRAPEFAVPPRKETKNLDMSIFSIFSDSSMDGDMIDPADVNRRFEAMARGEVVPATPLATIKRRRVGSTPVSQGHRQRQNQHRADNHISLSQVRDDLKVKEKAFFKSKRSAAAEPKSKKLKNIDEEEKQ